MDGHLRYIFKSMRTKRPISPFGREDELQEVEDELKFIFDKMKAPGLLSPVDENIVDGILVEMDVRF